MGFVVFWFFFFHYLGEFGAGQHHGAVVWRCSCPGLIKGRVGDGPEPQEEAGHSPCCGTARLGLVALIALLLAG